ncbi:MFS transporter [Enterococcus raffinosus]|uniref:MFS transporter n=2 Tax=Enterococcus TaxID=1350 RepID=A0AAW8T016_9ENTE|nr:MULTISPECIES: MFS transporter [Enterococcus]MDK7991625.1 MFS transporter [Enterococcus raffinosus]MDT2522940.1 MFS transporter [Enterococcus raffinosus]MDT2533779.1 MFS transporter [Enterococcus raffinosus]MDT2539424.1 MFS transporter [Enterococcus raffinosus]MDT2590209.1 MFS transporter [Enterococcus raffinosus]
MENLNENLVTEKENGKAAYVVAFACMIAFMGIGLVDPILNSIAKSLQATPAQTTLLFTSYIMVTGIVMLFTGFVSSRIGMKKTLMLGLFIIIVFALFAGLSNTINALIYFRAGWGLGNALFISTALSAIVSVLIGQTEKSIMLYEAAMGLGMSIGPLVGGSLGSVSWRLPFAGVSILMLISFLSISIMFKEPKDSTKEKIDFFAGAKAMKNHKLRSIGLIALLYNFGFFTLLAYAPFLMPNFSEMEIGITFFGWGILLAISSIFLATRFERKIGTFYTLMIGFIGFVICLLLMGINADQPTLVAAALIVAGFFQGIINTLMTTIAMEIPGIKRNIASSTYSFVRFFGGSLAPFVAGMIGAKFGGNYTFYIASAMVLIGIILVKVHSQYFETVEEEESEENL